MPHEVVVQQFGLSPMRNEILGKTERTQAEFHLFLDSIHNLFQQSTYDLFRNNCNHFSDAAAKFLLNGVGIPSEIIDLPNRVLATPIGQMLAPMWSSMQQRMQEQFVPFNASASSSLATSPTATMSAPVVVNYPKVSLVEGLKHLTEECSAKELVLALDTLAKLVKNIISNPHEEKYRRVSLGNEKFKSSLGRYTHGIPCLLAVGFVLEPTGSHVYMAADPANWDKLVMCEKIVTAARKKAIRTFVEKSNVTSAEQALHLVDQKDPVAQEVVNSMFPKAS